MSFEEQIMSADKYPSIVLCQMETCVYYPCNLSRSTRGLKIEEYLCQALPATFIASRVKICPGDDVYHVPQPSSFHKTLAT